MAPHLPRHSTHVLLACSKNNNNNNNNDHTTITTDWRRHANPPRMAATARPRDPCGPHAQFHAGNLQVLADVAQTTQKRGTTVSTVSVPSSCPALSCLTRNNATALRLVPFRLVSALVMLRFWSLPSRDLIGNPRQPGLCACLFLFFQLPRASQFVLLIMLEPAPHPVVARTGVPIRSLDRRRVARKWHSCTTHAFHSISLSRQMIVACTCHRQNLCLMCL